MLKFTRTAGFLFTVLCVLACSDKRFDSDADMLDYLKDEDHGYMYRKEIRGFDFSLMYRPTDLLVAQDLGTEQVDPSDLNSKREQYGKYLYFTLNIGKGQQELLSAVPRDRNEFGAMVQQLAFGMHQKVHVYTASKDTLNIVDYSYPRTYGMSPSTTMLFVYPKKEEVLTSSELHFTIEDIGLGTGEVRFKIPVSIINNQPQLSFN